MAFFLTANYDTVIASFATLIDADHPAKYKPVTAGEDLIQKLIRQYTREGEEAEDFAQGVNA